MFFNHKPSLFMKPFFFFAGPSVLLAGACYFLSSCNFDELPPLADAALCDSLGVTYNNSVKEIIDGSCAYSGCHVSGGLGFGIYTDYNGDLLDALNSGSFQKWVIDQKDDPVQGMPPDQSAYPESLKDDLTEEELQIYLTDIT